MPDYRGWAWSRRIFPGRFLRSERLPRFAWGWNIRSVKLTATTDTQAPPLFAMNWPCGSQSTIHI